MNQSEGSLSADVSDHTDRLSKYYCMLRKRERVIQKRQGQRLKRQTEKDANIEEREKERKGRRQR